MEPGTQIIYVPQHLEEEYEAHRKAGTVEETFGYPNGVQPGFIAAVSKKEHAYFCRYWRLDGKRPVLELRTWANSELTYARNLRLFTSVGKSAVDHMMEGLGYGTSQER